MKLKFMFKSFVNFIKTFNNSYFALYLTIAYFFTCRIYGLVFYVGGMTKCVN